MSGQKVHESITRVTENDLTGKIYTLVTTGVAAGSMKSATAGAKILGVTQEEPQNGKRGTIAVDGIVKVKLGGVVAEGDSCASDANGLGVAAGAGVWALGVYLDAGVAGDIVRVLVDRHKA